MKLSKIYRIVHFENIKFYIQRATIPTYAFNIRNPFGFF